MRWILQQKIRTEAYFLHNQPPVKMYTMTKCVKKGKTFSEFFNFWVVNSAIIY